MMLPTNLDTEPKKQVEQAIAESFVSGYRVIMFLAACLAVAGAAGAGALIKKKEK